MSAIECHPEPYGFGEYDYATRRDQDGMRARKPRRSPSCDCAEPRFDRVQLRFALATEWCCACSRPSAATLKEFKADIVANGTRRWTEALVAELGRMVDRLGKAMAALVEPARAFASAAAIAGADLGTVQRMILHSCEATVKWDLREPPWQACLERWSAGKPWCPWLWVPTIPALFRGVNEAVHPSQAEEIGTLDGVLLMAMEGPPLVLDAGEHPEVGELGFEVADGPYARGCITLAGGDVEQLVDLAAKNLRSDGRPLPMLTIVAPRSELDLVRRKLRPKCVVRPGTGALPGPITEEVQSYDEARAGLHTAAMLAGIDTKLALDTAIERARRSTLSPAEAIDAERFAIEDRSNRVSPRWAEACLLASRGHLERLEEFGVMVRNREANIVLAVAHAGELEFRVDDPEARRFAIDRLTDWFAARQRDQGPLRVPPTAMETMSTACPHHMRDTDPDRVMAAFTRPLVGVDLGHSPSKTAIVVAERTRGTDGEWITRIAALLEGANEVFVAGEISDQAALTVAHREAGFTFLTRSAKPWWSERAPSFQRMALTAPDEHRAALCEADVVVLFTEAAAYVATSKSDKLHTLPRPSYEDKAMAFMENRPEPADGDGECTGVAASWCPLHGDCTCPRDEDGGFGHGRNGPTCPLHAAGSTHATTLHGGMLEPPQAAIRTVRSTEELVAALGGPSEFTIADLRRPVGMFTSAPGELDGYPVGQAPGEPEAFSRVLASLAAPRVHREPPPVEHDPGAALATMRGP